MAEKFIDVEDTTHDPDLPPPPVDPDVVIEVDVLNNPAKNYHERFAHLLPHGTTVSRDWTEEWIKRVIQAEKQQGYAVCGAKRSTRNMSIEEIQNSDPLTLVCKRRAGWGTEHSGEGRCKNHGGNQITTQLVHGGYSLLNNSKLSTKVNNFFDDERLLDTRSTIATTWAVADGMLEDVDEITPQLALDVGNLMTRIANMINQHNQIQEKRKITIDVPEFMAWADYFYELAAKHIQAADGDVAAFLREANQYYERTVSTVVGDSGRRDRFGEGD